MDPRTPILVGAGTAMQRFDDPRDGVDVIELMATAVRNAAADAGGRSLLDRVGLVLSMKGMWPYADPGGLDRGARRPVRSAHGHGRARA